MDIKRFARMEEARQQGKLEEAIERENFTVMDLLAIHEIVSHAFTRPQLQAVCKDLILVIQNEQDPVDKEAWRAIYNVAYKRLVQLEAKNND